MDTSSYQFNPIVETIVDTLTNKTQNYDRNFFRLQTNFYLALVPACLNISVQSKMTGKVPINLYAVNLSSSGSGKGYSTHYLETQVLGGFRDKFNNEIYPQKVTLSLDSEAMNRASLNNTSFSDTLDKVKKEFKSYGEFKFTFDSATSPAVKQYRQKIILGKIGSINFIVDEVGANLKSNLEPLYTFLELYDKGIVKDKLVKSTQDNQRFKELVGSTPANLLLFGTPSKLLDGGSIENEFFELLEMGYARRCFFSFSKKVISINNLTPEELYETMSSEDQELEIERLSFHLADKADISTIGSTINTPKPVELELIKYKQNCELRASELPEHQEILKAELSHRYFKVLKLAALYAFIDDSVDIQSYHLQQAIKFAEESGQSLTTLMYREKPYVRLAKFIADNAPKALTLVDLQEELPYFKGTNSQKNELLQMAIAWGYTNHILIKRNFNDGIEFISGESLKKTNLNQIRLAYSQHLADGYTNEYVDWNDPTFEAFLSNGSYGWTNHFTSTGKRLEDDMMTGFNMIVLDVDTGNYLNQVKEILKEYEYLIYTTKRHQQPNEQGRVFDRFRILLPINYELHLSKQDYEIFMKNIQSWFPFEVDASTFQRSRKWQSTSNTQIFRNQGELLDVLNFVPKTYKEAEFNKDTAKVSNLFGLERWFAQRMVDGDRNNQLLKYALLLLEHSSKSLYEVQEYILEFNKKLSNPLEENEIKSTIFVTLANKRK